MRPIWEAFCLALLPVVGAQPAEGAQIPGIRKWPEAYLPKIYDPSLVDSLEPIGQAEAETMARRLAAEEGIFGGISSAGALVAALRVQERVRGSVQVRVREKQRFQQLFLPPFQRRTRRQ